MVTIRNDHDLRMAYGFLRIFKEDIPDSPIIAEYKRNIREYHRENAESDRRIVRDDGMDGYVVLIELPAWIETKDEAKEYFDTWEYIEPYYTYYDCTGRPFTSWYKVFERRGRWMAYHSVGFDV